MSVGCSPGSIEGDSAADWTEPGYGVEMDGPAEGGSAEGGKW